MRAKSSKWIYSPVVELSRAVVVSMARGPAAGLAAVDIIDGLAKYHLLPSVRGDLLLRLGRIAEARQELQRAISLATNARAIELLTTKLNGIGEERNPAI